MQQPCVWINSWISPEFLAGTFREFVVFDEEQVYTNYMLKLGVCFVFLFLRKFLGGLLFFLFFLGMDSRRVQSFETRI